MRTRTKTRGEKKELDRRMRTRRKRGGETQEQGNIVRWRRKGKEDRNRGRIAE